MCFNFETGNCFTNKRKWHWISSTVKNKKKEPVFFFHTENFSITFSSTNFSNLFPRLASAGTETTCRVAEYWTYWQNPSMFIKWDFSIIDLKHLVNIDLSIITCRRMVIYVSYNSSLVICYLRQPLLDNNEGFLFCCKSTIRQPSHAVSGLKDVPKQFWQKQEVFLTENCLE